MTRVDLRVEEKVPAARGATKWPIAGTAPAVGRRRQTAAGPWIASA
jgi:hypothetical protein